MRTYLNARVPRASKMRRITQEKRSQIFAQFIDTKDDTELLSHAVRRHREFNPDGFVAVAITLSAEHEKRLTHLLSSPTYSFSALVRSAFGD